jgi:hypothetical protein
MTTTRPIFSTTSQPTRDGFGPPLYDRVKYSDSVNNMINSNNYNNGLICEDSQLIASLLLDIRVVTDVCKNLQLRAKQLEARLSEKNEIIQTLSESNNYHANYQPHPFTQVNSRRGEDHILDMKSFYKILPNIVSAHFLQHQLSYKLMYQYSK